jgi:hypothetical protein
MFRAEAVLVAVPGGSVGCVPGAVTGIESKAVIDGTSRSGAMSQNRSAFTSAHQGARRSQGQKSASCPAVQALRASGWPAIILRQRKG